MKRLHARNASWAFIAVAVVLGAPPPAFGAATAIDHASLDVVSRLRDSVTVAQQRAAAIAAVPILVYAVATDQQTMLDMTAEELSFHTQPGEIVEVGQRYLKSGKIVSLRREGSGSLVHLPLGSPGVSIVIVGDAVYSVAVVEVQPRERSKILRGVVGVAKAVDLAEVTTLLAKLGGAVELRVGQERMMIGQAPAHATTVLVHAPLGAQREPVLAVLTPPPRHPIGAALMVLGAGIGLALLLRRRHTAVNGGFRPGPGAPAATR